MLRDFDIYDDLMKFTKSEEKGLNVISTHLNGVNLFRKFIETMLLENKEIVYVVNGEVTCSKAYEMYEDIRNTKAMDDKVLENNFKIVNFYDALNLSENKYLIILDDINEFPEYKNIELKSLINTIYNKCDKIISYSIESIFKDFSDIKIEVKSMGKFIVEPRFLNTTLDVKASIPTILYEFFDFFSKEDRKVMVLVPNEEVGQGIIEYIKRINLDMSNNFLMIDEYEEETIETLLGKNNPYFFITTKYMELGDNYKFDYIITNASLSQYTYKQFVYLATRASMKDELNGELILVSNEVTENMNTAKSITREFNKELWENESFKLD